MEIGEGYKTFFQEFEENCPITKCELKDYGCDKPYTAEYLSIGEESPW